MADGQTMRWRSLPTGAGGFVTGIMVDPNKPGRVLARTDVGGLFSFNSSTQHWRQLLSESSRPAGTPTNVESVAIDSNSDGTIYAAVGNSLERNGVFLKTVDGGESWRTLSGPPVPVQGNADFRWAGERLTVDPNNSDVLYFGSRTVGLWSSDNGGERWSQVPTGTVPIGQPHATMAASGVTFVLFDHRSAVISGKTSVIYAGVSSRGIYRSDDAGRTWRQSLAYDGIPQQAAIDAAGTLYVTFFGNGNRTAGKVSRLTNGTWQTISPVGGADFSALTVDRSAAGRVWVATYPLSPDGVFHSEDAGQTWQRQSASMTSTPGWWPGWSLYTLTGGLAYDATQRDALWLSTGFGTLHTTEATSPSPRWEAKVSGIELTVTFDAISTESGALVTGIADFDGFRHGSLDSFPAVTHGRGEFITTTSIAVMGSNPKILVSAGANHHEPWRRRAGYSTDNGRTWTTFPSISGGQHPEALNFGNIAVSATDANNVVWQPTNWEVPYYTIDGGRSWRRLGAFDSAPYNGGAHTHLWNGQRALAADMVKGGVFYLYHHVPGHLLRSVDKGVTWSVANGSLPSGYWNSADLQTVPRNAGHVWLALGYGGLFRSSDCGSTFIKDGAVSRANVIGFGAPLGSRTMPTAYVQGIVNGVDGVFRSVDGGGSWARIGGFGLSGAVPRVIAGDMNVFERVYLGTDGNGFLVGELTLSPAPEEPPTTVGAN